MIALSLERQATALLDDSKARSVARHLGLNIVGTTGMLVIAKHKDIIPLCQPILDDLRKSGFWLADDVHDEVLRLSGERT